MDCTYLIHGLECRLPHVDNGYITTQGELSVYCKNPLKMQTCPRYQQYLTSKRIETDTIQKASVVTNVVTTNTNTNNNYLKVTFNEKLSKAFESAYNIVESKKFNPEEEDEINSRLVLLETELKKNNNVRDRTKIQRLSDWIKRNSKDIFVVIEPIVKEVLDKKGYFT
jgi:hypothetical protein